MREDQTPDAQDSFELHFKTERGDETVTLSKHIEEIDLSRRQVQSIDLAPLSSCSRLMTLDVSFNLLQSIDLTPLSSCGRLVKLDLNANHLQSMDLSPLASCSDLRVLYLGGNLLQSVDLTPLSLCTGLRELYLDHNQLQSITLLSGTSLHTLVLDFNKFQNIDLSPLSSCMTLQVLFLDRNEFQSIDLAPLSSCGSLEWFVLNANQLQSIDLSPLSSCTSLRTLELSSNQLQSIDLSPLSSCNRLQTLSFADNPTQTIQLALSRETLSLLVPELVLEEVEQRTPSRDDVAAICRVVDTLWHSPYVSKRWTAHAVVQDFLSGLGLGWLGLLDVEPTAVMATMNDTRENRELADGIIELVCRQIDAGGTTIGLDMETMVKDAELATRAQRVLKLRMVEMQSVQVAMHGRSGSVDLRVLWLTAYGHNVLSAMRLGANCSSEELEEVRRALTGLGFSLRRTVAKPVTTNTPSSSLCEYIWKLADFRAKEKKR